MIEAYDLQPILSFEVIHESSDFIHNPSVDEDLAVLVHILKHNWAIVQGAR